VNSRILAFLARRLVRALITLVLFQTVVFVLIQSVPGDFASIAGAFGGRSARAAIQQRFGLDQPLLDQYLDWMWRTAHLDFGVSFLYWPDRVSEILVARAPRTLLVFLAAAVLSYAVGLWLGKQVAWRRGARVELVTTAASVAAHTSFAPWLGFLALNVFAWNLGWFPYQNLVNFNKWLGADISIDAILLRMVVTGGLVFTAVIGSAAFVSRVRSPRRRLTLRTAMGGVVLLSLLAWWALAGYGELALDVAAHLTLPLGTVVLLSFGETLMTMRATMLETMGADHVTAARARGLPDANLRDRHVARVAMLPVLSRLLLSLPFVLVGSLVIERVFFWPAMGQVLFNAIEFQDLPMIAGVLSLVGGLVVLAHVLLDLLYLVLDPRLRHG
jgi:peptide/nickel transport system permease protein